MGSSDSSPMAAARVTRPARNYDAVVVFYRDLLGLPLVASFEAHDGYAGTVFGLPDRRFQFEVTQHVSGGPLPAPTAEDLLVVYYADEASRAAVEQRLEDSDVAPASLENPYWAKVGARAYVDPDGWLVVLARATRPA